MARKKKNEKDAPVAIIDEAATIEEKEEPEASVVKFDGKEYTVAFVAGSTVRLTDGKVQFCVSLSAIEFE